MLKCELNVNIRSKSFCFSTTIIILFSFKSLEFFVACTVCANSIVHILALLCNMYLRKASQNMNTLNHTTIIGWIFIESLNS